jgi:hypothetical protein
LETIDKKLKKHFPDSDFRLIVVSHHAFIAGVQSSILTDEAMDYWVTNYKGGSGFIDDRYIR